MQLKTVFAATVSSIVLVCGAAFAADQESSRATSDPKEAHTQQPPRKKVKPHSHPRDEKGIPSSDKKQGKAAAGANADRKMEPHSHMRDEKHMNMPSQSGNSEMQEK